MNKQHNGHFKTGDCIGISGKHLFLVMEANENAMWVSRFVEKSFAEKDSEQIYLHPDRYCYSNKPGDYAGKYWISKVSGPEYYKEYKLLRFIFF